MRFFHLSLAIVFLLGVAPVAPITEGPDPIPQNKLVGETPEPFGHSDDEGEFLS